MSPRFASLLVVAAAVWVGAGRAVAQGDCENCKDRPYLTRMPNYNLTGIDETEFNAFDFYDGTKRVTIEGRLFKMGYAPKEGVTKASALQIRRNYANAIKKAGGTVFLDGACSGEKCGNMESVMFLSGKLKQKDKEIWIQVLPGDDGDWYEMVVCERGEMKQDVTVSAGQMLSALDSDGHIALYILFDSNKAIIKAESEPIIAEIVKLMNDNEPLKLSVEGHTDSSGDAKLAKKLSEDRAKAVVKAVTKAGIDASRLKTAGWGASKPVADNSSEDGRAKNRRVELVKLE